MNVSSQGILLGQQSETDESSQPIEDDSSTVSQEEHPISVRDEEMERTATVKIGGGLQITKIQEVDLTQWTGRPTKLTTTLLTYLLGKEKLKNMSRTGKGNRQAIPKNVLDTVQSNNSRKYCNKLVANLICKF